MEKLVEPKKKTHKDILMEEIEIPKKKKKCQAKLNKQSGSKFESNIREALSNQG